MLIRLFAFSRRRCSVQAYFGPLSCIVPMKSPPSGARAGKRKRSVAIARCYASAWSEKVIDQMEPHKFKLRQTVELLGKKELGLFEVARLMPIEHGERQYRIRSLADGRERVSAEAELIPAYMPGSRIFHN